jgi:hypothetical protein
MLPPVRCLPPKDFEGNGNYQFALRLKDNNDLRKKLSDFARHIVLAAKGPQLDKWFPGKTVDTMQQFQNMTMWDDDEFDTSLWNIKLSHWQGIPKFELFNKNRKLVYGKQHKKKDLESILQKNAVVTCIIRCNGIWINETKFGFSFSLVQALVEPPEQQLKGVWIGGAGTTQGHAEEDEELDS